MPKKLFSKKSFLSRIEDAEVIGVFNKDQADFLRYIVNNFDDLEKDARRYRAFLKRMVRGIDSSDAKKECQTLNDILDKELDK